MKLVGIRDGLRTVIGRQFDDGMVAPLAEATEFYADLPHWTAAAAALQSGERSRDGIDEAPAVPPAARRAVRRTELPAARRGSRPPDAGRSPGVLRPVDRVAGGGGVPVPVPAGEPGLDWEVELAAVVRAPAAPGRPGRGAVRGARLRRVQRPVGPHPPDALAAVDGGQERRPERSHLPVVTADEVGDPRRPAGC